MSPLRVRSILPRSSHHRNLSFPHVDGWAWELIILSDRNLMLSCLALWGLSMRKVPCPPYVAALLLPSQLRYRIFRHVEGAGVLKFEPLQRESLNALGMIYDFRSPF